MDQPPPPPGLQSRIHRPREKKRAGRVHALDLLPLRERDLLDRIPDVDARAVDGDVDAPVEGAIERFTERKHRGLGLDVGCAAMTGAAAQLRQGLGRGACPLRVPRDDADAGTVGGEPFGHGPSQARRTAHDHGRGAREVERPRRQLAAPDLAPPARAAVAQPVAIDEIHWS